MTRPARDAVDLRRWTPAAAGEVAYLNTGTCGPLLAPVAEVMRRKAERELAEGRVGAAAREETLAVLGSLREALGRYLGAGGDEIALTHHTTEGMNIVTWGLGLGAGDRAVTTTLEHAGALAPLYLLRRRAGVQVDFADIGAGDPEETLAALGAALERPAALVVISHVTYGTGAVLPVPEIAALAHERGALLLVDGAQSVGALPLDLEASGADFYAFPAQKWLCGPEGVGGLYVRREHLDRLQATFTGFRGIDHDVYRADDPDSLAPAPGARRYETGSAYRPALAGALAGVEWHLGPGAQGGALDRTREMARHALQAASALPGASVLTPSHAHAGLVSFIVRGVDPAACVRYLADGGAVIRSVPESGALRLSCGFFNTAGDIDRAIGLVEKFQRAGT